MDNLLPSRLLFDANYYAAHFMDLATWEPAVRGVCIRHSFTAKRVRPGLAGSFPTFMVDLKVGEDPAIGELVAVKFFGPLFDGHHSFAMERLMGRYLTKQCLPIPSPRILAEGELTPEWKYLIFEGVSGVSIGQVRQQLPPDAWVSLAGEMGTFMQALHTSTAKAQPTLTEPSFAYSWDGYVDFLQLQHANCQASHLRWNDLPPQLVSQVQGYLLPVELLVDLASPAHLIHADLTADHVLGRTIAPPGSPPPKVVSVSWESLAIIDWGDARIGNILYELVALYLDLLGADKHLLSICTQGYGLPAFYQSDFPHKALCMVLLHQFPMPATVYAPYRDVQSLQELAEGLFGI